ERHLPIGDIQTVGVDTTENAQKRGEQLKELVTRPLPESSHLDYIQYPRSRSLFYITVKCVNESRPFLDSQAMGQSSSKKGSYTPGRDGQPEGASTPRANGDVKVSGSREDLSASGGVTVQTPELNAQASATPSTSGTGKKDKRRRFRVPTFSIGRTPSGRWSRKKRLSSRSRNRARPVSCPIPPTQDVALTPDGRPQSLFLEELDVSDEETIGTVDLSDHEQEGKNKSRATHKSAEKTKGKRGSQKKQTKKKPKEKKLSKKELKKLKLKLA
ncbi:unnamed protein product, partial [Lymnaea stagnalis]